MMMRKSVLLIVFFVLAAGSAMAGTGDYVDELNVYASKYFGEFKAELSTRYGISGTRFDLMLRKVDSPGDLAVALWLGEKSYEPIDAVVRQYRIHRGKGWGVIAKELGIKPGSPTFQQLKKGDIQWYPANFHKKAEEDKKQKALERKREKRKRRQGY